MSRLLVALALVIATVQCAAACTPVPTGCPHHQQCTRELVPATIVQPSAVHVVFSTEAIEISFPAGARVSLNIPVVQAYPPLRPQNPILLT